ncbi:MAG: hypothetical protein NVS3B25_34760 [Hymenobacter sp.]
MSHTPAPYAVAYVAAPASTLPTLQDAYARAFWRELGAREVLTGLPVAAQNQAQERLLALRQATKAAFNALYPPVAAQPDYAASGRL